MIHAEKIEVQADEGLMNKIAEAAFQQAKTTILANPAGQNKSVRMFSFVIIDTIWQGQPEWVKALSYFALSNLPTLTKGQALTATQDVVSQQVAAVYQLFCKSQYKDIS